MNSFIDKNKYWFFVVLTYLSLIYSTSLHQFFGVERTVSLAYFVQDEDTLKNYHPDIGTLKDIPIETRWKHVWKLTSFAWDAGYYLIESHHIKDGIPPYKYRIFPILLVQILSSVFQISREMSFVIMNFFVILITAILFNIFLIRDFNFSKRLAFIGGILFITSFTVTSTTSFPMLDPISLFWSVLIFISVKRRNVNLFLFSTILGILSKEVLLFGSIMWFIENVQLKNKLKLIKDLLISGIPIVIFSMVRILLGGNAFEVEFGHNLLKGDFPVLWIRFIELSGLWYVLKYTFFSFTFLWLGLYNINKHIFFKKHIIIIPLVVIAAGAFSAQVSRPLGVLFPLVITMFLYFFEQPQKDRAPII